MSFFIIAPQIYFASFVNFVALQDFIILQKNIYLFLTSFFKFLLFVMTSPSNHDNHCLLS